MRQRTSLQNIRESREKVNQETFKTSNTSLFLRCDTMEKPLEIITDTKEASKAVKIVDGLRNSGVNVITEPLEKGDYILSTECAVERKTVYDFVGTLTKRNLFEEIFPLKNAYPHTILLLEGYMPLIYKFSKVNPAVIYGALYSLAKNGIGIIPTINQHETVIALCTMARQEQVEEKRYLKVHPIKTVESLSESQIFFIGSLPNIGREKAKSILAQFYSPISALNAVNRWHEVEGIGPKIIEKVKKVLESPFS